MSGWNQSRPWLLQKTHHNLMGLAYCVRVEFAKDASAISVDSSGNPFLRNAWLTISLQPGKCCARSDVGS